MSRSFMLILLKICKMFVELIPVKKIRRMLRHKIKNTVLKINTPKDKDFTKIKANFLFEKEALQYIVKNKCSVSRYGDGEIGFLLFDKFKHFFQPYNKELQDKLKFILKNPIDSCLICLPKWMFYPSNIQWYKRCQAMYFFAFKKYILDNYKYGSANIFTSESFDQGNYDDIIKIWKNKPVVIITGKNSAFIEDDRLFKKDKIIKVIETKAVDAFSDYDNILSQILNDKNITKDCVIVASLGLTATVLAYDLSKLGYRCIDIGNVTNAYKYFMKEMPAADDLRITGDFVDGVTDIKKFIKKKN